MIMQNRGEENERKKNNIKADDDSAGSLGDKKKKTKIFESDEDKTK